MPSRENQLYWGWWATFARCVGSGCPWKGFWCPFGTVGPGEAKFVRKTTKPGEFVFLVFGDLFGPQSPGSDWLCEPWPFYSDLAESQEVYSEKVFSFWGHCP